MASPDPEVRRAAAQHAAAARISRLDRAGRQAMNATARQRLAELYVERAQDQLGPDATQDEVDDLAGRLRRLDAAKAALKSAQVRRERREAAELDALLAAGVTP